MNKAHFIRATVAVFVGALITGGCAVTPVVSKRNTDLISGVTRIVLAPPVVECIDVKTSNPLPLDEGAVHDVQSSLVNGFRSELAAKQIVLVEVNEIPDVDIASLSMDLGHTYLTIKRHYSPLDSAQEEQLSWLATMARTSHLMFCRCRFYSGPDGYWGPISGEILLNSSRVVLECHLYDIQNKVVIWTRTAKIKASQNTIASSASTMVSIVLDTLEFE